MIETHELPETEHAAWNALIAESPEGNVFLHTDWLRMLCDTDPDLRILKACCSRDGKLVGGQVICYRRRWGMNLATDFEFFYGGPFVAPSFHAAYSRRASEHIAIVSALADWVAPRLATTRWETHPAFRDARPYLYGGWEVRTLYAHIWKMRDTEQIWKGMAREKHREIKRAQELCSFAVEQKDAALDAFLPLYRGTMRKYSWWPSPTWEMTFRERFRWMRKRDGCRLYTARTADGEMQAGCLALLSREDNTAYLWRQGSGNGRAMMGVIPALYWHAAVDLASEFAYVNFGGSPEMSLSSFKDYLGAEVAPHFQISRCNSPTGVASYDAARRLKDVLHNVLMRLAAKPILWLRAH